MFTGFKKASDLTVPVVATIAAVFGMGILAPSVSHAQDRRQKDKNTMRNIAIGAAAGAIYSGVKGNKTAAIALGAGAAYAGKKYEDARKAQTRESNDSRFGYDYPRYEDRYRNESYRGDDDRHDDYGYDGRRDSREIRYAAPRSKGNNGKHKGWYKQKNKNKKCDD